MQKIKEKETLSSQNRLKSKMLWGVYGVEFIDSFGHSGYSERVIEQYSKCFIQLSDLFKGRFILDIYGTELSLLTSERYLRLVISKGKIIKTLTTFRNYQKYLIKNGHLCPPKKDLQEGSWTAELDNYGKYLENVKGLSLSSTYSNKRSIEAILKIPSIFQDVLPREIEPKHVLSLIQKKRLKAYQITSLRCFLEYLKTANVIEYDLVKLIPSSIRRREYVPKVITRSQIEEILESFPLRTPLEIRNYTMVLLCARLGLRVLEVLRVRVSDINWTKGEILIRGKGNKDVLMPFSQDLGDSIVKYLKVRPKTKSDFLFIKHKAPYTELKNFRIVSVELRKAFERTSIDPPSMKIYSNIFRHSFATNMLSENVNMSVISDMMRHSNIRTTMIYAKYDYNNLRTISPEWVTAGVSHDG